MKIFKKVLVNFSMIIGGIAMAFVILEMTLRISSAAGIWNSPEINWDQYVNTYTGDGFNCTFQEALEPHPYLGWILAPYLPCGRFNRNNRGFQDQREFPTVKDPNFYTILVTGGSVAAQFAFGAPNPKKPHHWLEEELKKNFVSPNGKPFRVLSAAMGVWRMPTQIVATAMYGYTADAVISLDGYNEMQSELAESPVDMPDRWTSFAVLNQKKGKFILDVMKGLKTYRIVASSTPILRSSVVLYAVFEGIKNLVSDSHGNMGEAEELQFQLGFHRKMDAQQRAQANAEKWQNYLRGFQGMTRSLGIKYAHFIQPIPTMGKVLTEQEKKYATWVSPEDYKKIIIDPAEKLVAEGVPVVSLAMVFADTKETVYHDEIHCGYDEDQDSIGYRIMAKSMANSLGQLWKLKRIK